MTTGGGKDRTDRGRRREVESNVARMGKKPQQAERRQGDSINLTPAFKLIFRSVLAITFVSLLVMVALAILIKEPSDQVKSVLETCSTTFKLGVGAILGLLSGRTA